MGFSPRGTRASTETLAPALQLHDLISARKHHHAGHADKQSVFDNSRHLAQRARESVGVSNLTEPAVENVIVLIGEIRFSVRSGSDLHMRSQRRNPLDYERLREADHFHRKRKLS